MSSSQPFAGLSLDLDNKWSYMKIHGDPGWESFPSYLDVVVPRFLEVLKNRSLRVTVFVVGQDAVLPENTSAIASIGDAGHEVGNHSFCHEPWLHLFSESEIDTEIARAEEAILSCTGQRPYGFRGPGFSLSSATLRVLSKRGYRYDASTFPTFLGPLARAYYFLKSGRLTTKERTERSQLFGTFREGFRPLRPYRWTGLPSPLIELPVTTMPILKTPIHLSYLLYLSSFSRHVAVAYFRTAVASCVLTRTPLFLLLHPLDFLGSDDHIGLNFFPGMNLSSGWKLAFVDEILRMLSHDFDVKSLGQCSEIAMDADRSIFAIPAL